MSSLPVVLLVAAVACGGDDAPTTPDPDPGPGPGGADTLDVFTPGNVFSPSSAEIDVGDVVRFRISESPDGRGHNVIFSRATDGAPADVPIVKDTAVLRTFSRAGLMSYTCTIHPGMDGEVIVR
jgi:plastocyanin